MADPDYLYALELQKQLNGEAEVIDSDPEEVIELSAPAKVKSKYHVKYLDGRDDHLNSTQNLVHPEWEVLDPTPDIKTLFGTFDNKFFQGKLKCVSLEWSKRMYSCAGICYSRRNRFGMEITIRLSEPLLKLRPRKNLVETLLHEMIHAYCFVLNIREGNGGHGPYFKKIMQGINKVAGTNITVYHTFHDEVALYKQHVWRCNGLCQNRPPFFGYVKRTSNRAPGPNDQWWAAHLSSCGGYFLKIGEPEKKKKESSKKQVERPAGTGDLRKYFGSTNNNSNTTNKTNDTQNVKSLGDMISSIRGPVKTNGGGTMLLNPRTKSATSTSASDSSIAKAFPPTSYPGLSSDPFNTDAFKKPSRAPVGGNLANVRGLRDLGSSNSEGGGNSGRAISGFNTSSDASMTGKGYSLDSQGPSHCNSTTKTTPTADQVDREHLRNIWAKRFETANKTNKETEPRVAPSGDSKRRRISSDASDDILFVADEVKKDGDSWNVVDDDIMIRDQPDAVITLSSDEDSDVEDNASQSTPIPKQLQKNMSANERQTIIKQEILDDTDDLNDEDIILIDDEYDDAQDNANLSAAIELADTSLIDEFFGEDTLLRDFKIENDVRPSGSRFQPNPGDDIITCPICQSKLQRKLLNEHLDGCTGISLRVPAPIHQLKKFPMPDARPHKPKYRKSKKQILRDAGYSEADLLNITSNSSGDEESIFNSSFESRTTSNENDSRPRSVRQQSIYKTSRQCPVCFKEVDDDDINEHLDECLENRRGRRKS